MESAEPVAKKKRRADVNIVPIKNTVDYQKMKLDRLMANPQKPVLIPESKREKPVPPPPEFVRNIMGSSAGAGSGEFHVYRHLRRKEYSRQKIIQEKSQNEVLDAEFLERREQKLKESEEKTAKKRAKRLKKKEAKKKAKLKNPEVGSSSAPCSDNDDEPSSEILNSTE